MSAPDTRLEKQRRRHGPVLIMIGAAAAFGVLMIILSSFAYVNTDDPSTVRESAEEVVGEERSVAPPPDPADAPAAQPDGQ